MKTIILKMTHFNQFNFALKLMLIACLSIFVISCSKDDDTPPEPSQELTQEIKNLIYFKGNMNASVVVVNAQGGPDTNLSTGEVDFIFQSVDTTDLLVVNVHQGQTLNPGSVEGNDITLDQAVDINAESVETLERVITFFKDQGRTVYVLGISFGAFVTQELIATKGVDVADKYLIMIGRLDMNDMMWQGMAEGRFGYFENGVTPVLDAVPAMDAFERNIARIAAGLGKNKYTERMSSIEDLSDLTYVYGATDEAVGRLTAEEETFLQSKNANIIEGAGGHDDTFDDFFEQALQTAFGLQ